ncbi:MAG: type II toxin-antitoxin system Phd/YefM family antitoxin [Clostridiales Family XIII bacterium]|nr:type II toxin-antitoxin system Phd/YefM family antitoxin [Clostridiales Family XIII bacterium]
MLNMNISDFRNNIGGLLEQTIKYNEPVSIRTKSGNVVLISEDDYNGLMETLYLCSIPGMKNRIEEGIRTPISECLSENDVEW